MRLNNLLVIVAAAASLLLAGCDNNNLLPSGEDKRKAVVAGSPGNQPTQKIENFTLNDINGTEVTLYDYIASEGATSPPDAIVIYFTMWCSICLTHMDHLYNDIRPIYDARGNVEYLVLDFVSGTAGSSNNNALAYGFASTDFQILVDSGNAIQKQLGGAMGVTLVVDASDGTILLNQEYGSGSRISEALDSLLPE